MKWGGAAVTVLLVVVWIGSGGWQMECFWPESPQIIGFVALQDGSLMWGTIVATRPSDRALDHAVVRMGFYRYPPVNGKIVWHWNLAFWMFHFRSACIPLWGPLVVVALATVSAWHLDTFARRRALLNLCPKCNYDRIGLADGAVCPECGSALP